MDSGEDRLELREVSFTIFPTFKTPETSFTPTVTIFPDTTTFTTLETSFTPTVTTTPNTTPGTTSGVGAASTRASTSGLTASPASTGSSSPGLSTGAKTGIGLGVPLGVLIIAGLVGLGYWLGRRKRAPAPNPQPELIAHELDPNTRYHAAEMLTTVNMTEIPASEWTGMGGQGVGAAELPESRRWGSGRGVGWIDTLLRSGHDTVVYTRK